MQNYRFEVKCVDGTSSPYLVAASLLIAGMDGVRKELPLKIQGVAGNGIAASLSAREREEKGILQRMPLDLEKARSALSTDVAMTEAFGKDFIDSYLAVNKVC